MVDWSTNPLVWIGAITALIIIVGGLIRIGQWIGKVNEAQSTFKTTLDSFMEEIRTDIKRILERMGPATATSGSPIRLTDLGQKISELLDAGAIADSLVPQFRTRVSGMQPYEVQELCFEYIHGNEFTLSDDIEALVLQCAFDNGINRKQVLDVIAIELRDRLLPRQEE